MSANGPLPWGSSPAPAATPLPPPRRRFARLPWILAALTFVTTTFAGAGFTERGGRALEALLTLDPLRFAGALPSVAAAGLPFSIAVMAFFFAHEMGHYVACRRYGVEATLPFFIPTPPPFPFGTMGAVIRIKSPIPSRRALFDIGAAGPLAGFAVALPLMALGILLSPLAAPGPAPSGAWVFGDSLLVYLLEGLLRPDAAATGLVAHPVFLAAWLGLLATAMNLIPAGQLDGGHVAYAVAPRWRRAIAHSSAAFLVALVAGRGLLHHEFSGWAIWAAIVLLFGRNHPYVPEDGLPLGRTRLILAAACLAILVLCFAPAPIAEVP